MHIGQCFFSWVIQEPSVIYLYYKLVWTTLQNLSWVLEWIIINREHQFNSVDLFLHNGYQTALNNEGHSWNNKFSTRLWKCVFPQPTKHVFIQILQTLKEIIKILVFKIILIDHPSETYFNQYKLFSCFHKLYNMTKSFKA